MTFVDQEQHQLVEQIADILIDHRETVSVAESSSGGLVSACLLSYPGASRYFVGSSVLYSYPIREALVGMGVEEHKPYGGSTPELVLDLATKFQQRIRTDWCIGEGGAAGPSPSPYGHPAGYTALAVSGPLRRTGTIETGLSSRADNMTRFTTELLRLFLAVLREHHPSPST
jgi:nicotinamide-nucleotide amidase